MNIQPFFEQMFDGIVWPATGSNEENFVTRKLHLALDPAKYSVLSNITLPSNGGKTTVSQIDQIIVSVYGIFCIETKSNHGWIFGSRWESNWTHWIGNKNHTMDNPFYQNYGHIKAIESILNAQNLGSNIKSFVALPEADYFEIQDTDDIGDLYQIRDKIKNYTETLYTVDECYLIVQQLKSANLSDNAVLENHKSEIRTLRFTDAQKVG